MIHTSITQEADRAALVRQMEWRLSQIAAQQAQEVEDAQAYRARIVGAPAGHPVSWFGEFRRCAFLSLAEAARVRRERPKGMKYFIGSALIHARRSGLLALTEGRMP